MKVKKFLGMICVFLLVAVFTFQSVAVTAEAAPKGKGNTSTIQKQSAKGSNKKQNQDNTVSPTGPERPVETPVEPPVETPEEIFSETAVEIPVVNSVYANMSASEFVTKLGMGWNLGNSLDAVKASGFRLDTETLWNNPVVTKDIFKAVANAGFTSVRIPVTYKNHIDANGVIDPLWFDRVEEVVNYALDCNLLVIINVHHDTGLKDTYRWIYADNSVIDESVANIKMLWTQIAARFSGYDERLVFESANEIQSLAGVWADYDNFNSVHAINQAFIDAVRSTGGKNTNRFLGIATYAAGKLVEMAEASLEGGYNDVVENKLMLAFHLYKTEISAIDKDITRFAAAAAKYNVPVYIGEFGTEKVVVTQDVRIAAAREYAKLAKELGIACFWWDNGTSYALFDRNTCEIIEKDLIDALIIK